MALVTLDQAKQHLRRDPLLPTEDDPDLALKLAAAEAVVLDHVAQRRADDVLWLATVTGWTAATAPIEVLAAILIQFAELARFRGDDDARDAGPARDGGTLHPLARMLVNRLRDPAIA